MNAIETATLFLRERDCAEYRCNPHEFIARYDLDFPKAIDELAQRQDVLLRLLQGLTGYMRNGWDDLPNWAITPEEPTAKS